jgi:surfactin synthase thioesterase subunit
MIDTKDLRGIARLTAELALQLAALPADGLRTDLKPLEDIELLASRILKEAAAARSANVRSVGESSGMWRAMLPLRP